MGAGAGFPTNRTPTPDQPHQRSETGAANQTHLPGWLENHRHHIFDKEAAAAAEARPTSDMSPLFPLSATTWSLSASTQVSFVPPPCDEFTTSEPLRNATRVKPPGT